jgi:hypothetical protein
MLGRNLMDDTELVAAARKAGVDDDDINEDVYRMEIDPPTLEDRMGEEELDRDAMDVNAANVPWSANTQVYLAQNHGPSLIQHCLLVCVKRMSASRLSLAEFVQRTGLPTFPLIMQHFLI